MQRRPRAVFATTSGVFAYVEIAGGFDSRRLSRLQLLPPRGNCASVQHATGDLTMYAYATWNVDASQILSRSELAIVLTA